MSEMIERAAEAAFMADWPKDNWSRFGNEDYVKNRYRRIARAAIEAMREPTEDMVTDAYFNADHTLEEVWERPSPEQGCKNIYIAMIDAALKEGKC